MHDDKANKFRQLLEQDCPRFTDRVDTPWDKAPDIEAHNRHAYRRIVLALKQISEDTEARVSPSTQGILVLGEAGSGKTHLLMRVARNLCDTNHILFVRRPNNE